MNKDIIYIDTEDDITAIIGKIKSSNEKIIALVPPKRTGVLQSAVNLRLLARTAKTNDKQLVLITTNKALIALSAPVGIPVAKNLQSKPEIAEVAEVDADDGEDIIEGKKLPVGELVKTVDHTKQDDLADDINTLNIDGEGSVAVSGEPEMSKPKIPKKPAIKVPDFSVFRKKLFLIGGGALFLIIFLVWAIWFAPSAKIIITAKTEPAPVSATLKLSTTAATDVNTNTIQVITKQLKKDVSVEFTATGQKDLGDKATGNITVRNCDYSSGISLPAGTEFTSDGGLVYVSKSSATVPGYTGLPSMCTLSGSSSGKVTVSVQASNGGTSYNNSGTSYSVSKIPTAAKVDINGTAMSGGTTKMSTVVTAEDVQKASQALVDLPTSDIKQQLTKQFTNGETVIGESFAVDRAAAVSAPAVGAEATGKVKLTSAGTFSISAISKSELSSFLNNSINKQVNDDQRIYSNGIDKVTLTGYQKNDQGAFVNVASVGQIGPNIDKDQIKKQVKGKHYGDVQGMLEGVKGVSSVDVKFSFFWVTTVPGDNNKIEIEFVIKDA
ncbi:hypothetical protein HGB25_02330 [Candidatus Saccharibacteria bacterium]|nr:hypothetical protein [Candidatus Saccharibacteria bacterium]